MLSWGDGTEGQLGRIGLRHSRRNGELERNMLRPTTIPGLKRKRCKDVFCGDYSTFLRTQSGQILACGLNNCGNLGIPYKSGLTIKDTQTIEKRVENKVSFLRPTEVQALNGLDIVEVAPGRSHALGLDADGKLHSWGATTYGALGRWDGVIRRFHPVVLPVGPVDFEEEQPPSFDNIAVGQVSQHKIELSTNLYCI